MELAARLREADGFVARSLKKALKPIDAEITATEERLEKIVNGNQEIKNKQGNLIKKARNIMNKEIDKGIIRENPL